MTDIIERAEAAFRSPHWSWQSVAKTFIPELIAELKATRAQRDQDLSDFAKNYAHMTAELKAVRAENERLRWGSHSMRHQ